MVTAATQGIVSSSGAVFMRKLGEAAGVEAMSLYNHVSNKDDLLDGMTDLVFSEIELPSAGDPWRPAMRDRAISMRTALTRHPWAISLINTRTSPGPATLRHHDAIIGCLRDGGFSIGLTGHAFAALDSYIYGFALQEQTLPIGTDDENAELVEAIMAQFPTEAYPPLAEFTFEHILRPGYSFAVEFEFGLDLLLDGLDRAHKAFRARPHEGLESRLQQLLARIASDHGRRGDPTAVSRPAPRRTGLPTGGWSCSGLGALSD